jgi:hypothetical protein
MVGDARRPRCESRESTAMPSRPETDSARSPAKRALSEWMRRDLRTICSASCCWRRLPCERRLCDLDQIRTSMTASTRLRDDALWSPIPGRRGRFGRRLFSGFTVAALILGGSLFIARRPASEALGTMMLVGAGVWVVGRLVRSWLMGREVSEACPERPRRIGYRIVWNVPCATLTSRRGL